ncbi:hypothetical protein AB1L88_15580 [Tautonia sp. JC769]|uniref:hypothetical protein n=1 Tax=Tautonia sp. JC769 TaxID=3232135 RepID=UPI003457B30B
MPTNQTAEPRFAVGDRVEKCSGDYRVFGEVRGVFRLRSGAVRYAVEIEAEGGGSFVHIYSESNLIFDTRRGRA